MAGDRTDRELDIVLFGATGFTGGLTAEYLTRHAPPGLRWAIAGRNPARLAETRDRLAALDDAVADLPLLTADATDPASLADVAARSRVVATTVGPYLEYGEPLVGACAEAGTDYLDLTGEPEFVDRMYLAHHATAVRTGARLVHACGFDSVPHDLGAYFTVQQLPADVPVTMRGVVRAGGRALRRHLPLGARRQWPGCGRSKAASAARRRVEARPEGRSSRAVQGKPHRDAVLGYWLLPLPTDRPDRSWPQRRARCRRTAPTSATPTTPAPRRCATRSAARPVRARWDWPRRWVRCATCWAGSSSRATGPTSGSGRRPGSPSTSSARAATGPSTPASPAATPATARPPRCSPRPRCAWPSTTTRRPPGR